MDDSTKRILDKLDQLDSRIDNIDVTLAKQHVSLEEHIRRTELLEQEVKPIKKHVDGVNAVLKFLGGITVVVGFLAALKELLF